MSSDMPIKQGERFPACRNHAILQSDWPFSEPCADPDEDTATELTAA